MKRKQKSLHKSVVSLLRTLAKYLVTGLLYGFWSAVLWLLMFPYQLYRVFTPKKQDRNIEGSRVSRWFRGVFENKKTRKFIGAGLTVLVMFFGWFSNILAANQLPAEETILATPKPELKTERTVDKPIEGVLGQGFHAFHRAIDILAPIGTEIKPIDQGEIVEVSLGRIGWGNTVVVEHERGLSSRYAHLDEIRVIEGEKITKDQVLGTVGMTGWTTGPHLHLEMYENGRAINPLEILPDFNGTLAYER